MDINPLQVLFGILLIFFVPGYLMVKALFPGRNELDKEYNIIYEIGLGMGLSIVITILDGFFLGSLHQLIGFRTVDGQQKGYFDTPYILASLLLICLLLFITAWYRGAFPWMGRLHPALSRVPASEKPQARKKRMDAQIIRLWDLSKERDKLRKEVRDCERKSRSHDSQMKSYYRKKLGSAREGLEKANTQIKTLEEERAAELAGLDEERRKKLDEKARRRAARKPLFGKKSDERPPALAGGLHPIGAHASLPPFKSGPEDLRSSWPKQATPVHGGLLSDENKGDEKTSPATNAPAVSPSEPEIPARPVEKTELDGPTPGKKEAGQSRDEKSVKDDKGDDA